MSGSLGELVVKISADHASFRSDLDRVRKSTEDTAKQMSGHFDKFGQTVSKVSSTFKIMAGTAAVGMLTSFVKSAIDAADEMGKMAQKVGMSTKELSALKYAGELADVSMDQLGIGLKQLDKNMVAAISGSKEQAAAFKALNVELKNGDGSWKTNVQVVKEIADRFSKLEDGTAKTTIAMKIFGKSGADLIPLLNAGADGLEDMRKEAERLGVVISEDTAKAAEQFNDDLTRLTQSTKGWALSLANDLLPALNEVVSGLNKTAQAEGFFGKLNAFTQMVRKKIFIGPGGTTSSNEYASFLKTYGLPTDSITAPAAATETPKPKPKTAGSGALNNYIRSLGGGGSSRSSAHSAASKAIDEAKKKEQELHDAMMNTWRAFASADQARADRFQAQAKDLSDLNVQVLELTGQYVKAAEAREAFERGTPEFRELVAGAKFGDANAALKLQGRNTIFDFDRQAAADREAQAAGEYGSFRTSMSVSGLTGIEAQRTQIEQSYQMRLSEAQKFYDSYHQDLEKFNQDCVAASKERDQAVAAVEKQEWEGRIQRISGLMGDLSSTLMEGNKEQFEAGKALAIASAIINTYMAASAAFAGITAQTGGWGIALAVVEAAMVTATGMAQVAAIEATNYSPRAAGGAVEGGQTYLIGEKGPELLTMGGNGYVTPNDQIGGGRSVNVTNVYQISTGVSETVRAELYRHMPVIAQHSVNAVQAAINSGTSLSKAVRRM